MKNLFDNDITLIEPEHKYILESDPNFEFKSVTAVTAEFFEPFDAEAIATNLVANYPKYKGMEVSELIEQWDAKRDHGTKVHNEIEQKLKKGKEPVEKKAVQGLNWLKGYKQKSDIDIYPEIIVYSKELKIAGSIDILAHNKNTNTYEIIDWKTSKSIETASFNGKMGRHPITSHLMDCKFVTYSMQLSFYRFLLETYYGLNVTSQYIAHLDGVSCKSYMGDYYKNEVIEIIKDLQNKENT